MILLQDNEEVYYIDSYFIEYINSCAIEENKNKLKDWIYGCDLIGMKATLCEEYEIPKN